VEPKILVITPIKHIKDIENQLNKIGDLTCIDDPDANLLAEIIHKYDAIFTNPNKSKVYLGRDILKLALNLKVICTASTGTNHIDKNYAAERNIKILSLTEERSIINKISSTAELAFALTMSKLRNINQACESVLNNEWDYEKFIGRQMNCLTIGVIGFGRLGSMYANYCASFGSNVLVFDPFKRIDGMSYKQVTNISELLKESDVISLHIHATKANEQFIDKKCIGMMKSDVLLINTSRGDIVDEEALVESLKENPNASVATDVLADEIRNRQSSPLLQYAKISNQILITPHIGGMTREAQEIAYGHAVSLLHNYFTRV
jgi:lactate dehydrogenase-like 2-hydroxyacid dehydrogenase